MRHPGKTVKVLANSLPKSGTHLLIRLFDLLGYKHGYYLMGSLARTDSTRNPFKKLMILTRRDPVGISVDMDDLSLRINPEWLEKKIRGQSGNRYYPAHLPHSEALEQLLIGQGVKIISIVRDPRDVAISYANYMLKESQYLTNFFETLPDMESRVKCVLSGCTDGGYTLAPLRERISRTIGWHHSNHVCSLKFENLVGSQGGGENEIQLQELRKILNFMGLKLTDYDIEALAADIFYKNSRTFHRGQVNQWKDLFSDRLKNHFKHECGELLRALGYEKSNSW
jgi:hypothetical protein